MISCLGMNNLEQVASNPQPLPKLWNKNFIILVLGSFVSIIGYSCATFTLGKFMLDTNNNDILLFAFSLAISMLPRLISPAIAGTYFDRHSRRKAIYTIDFMSAILFTLCHTVQIRCTSYSCCLCSPIHTRCTRRCIYGGF